MEAAGKMEIRQFVVGAIQTNCYALVCDGDCVVVDPGAAGALIAEHLADVRVVGIVATHGHHDHVCGVAALKRACPDAWFAIGADDAVRAQHAISMSSHVFDTSAHDLEDAPAPDRLLSDGDVVEVGSYRLTVIGAPGHTEGGIVLLGEGIALVGDTLFAGSAGRTDLAGGDYGELMRTLRHLKEVIPPATTLLCGHGEATTMARELASNPFLR